VLVRRVREIASIHAASFQRRCGDEAHM
jgi:hypothetical protein